MQICKKGLTFVQLMIILALLVIIVLFAMPSVISASKGATLANDVNSMLAYNAAMRAYGKSLATGVLLQNQNNVANAVATAEVTGIQKIKSEHFYIVYVEPQANHAAYFKYAVTGEEQAKAIDIGKSDWQKVLSGDEFAKKPIILWLAE